MAKKSAASKERERCLRIIAAHAAYAKSLDKRRKKGAPGAESLLIRIANQIRSGDEPLGMGEQMGPE